MSWICGLTLISMRPAPDTLARFWVSRNTRSPELAMWTSRAGPITRVSATVCRNRSAASHCVASRRPAITTSPDGPSWISNICALYVKCLGVLVAAVSRQPLPLDAAPRGLPSLISYAHSSVLAPVAWVRPAVNALGHREPVACPDALVADRIHHLPHQEHSVPADRSLPEAGRDVRRRQRERIELRAVVLDCHDESGVGQHQRHLDARRGARRRAVHDYVHEDFLERELEGLCLGRRQAGGRPELLQEQRQCRQMGRIARHGQAALRTRGPLRSLRECRWPVRVHGNDPAEATQLEHFAYRRLQRAQRERDPGTLRGARAQQENAQAGA